MLWMKVTHIVFIVLFILGGVQTAAPATAGFLASFAFLFAGMTEQIAQAQGALTGLRDVCIVIVAWMVGLVAEYVLGMIAGGMV